MGPFLWLHVFRRQDELDPILNTLATMASA